MFNNAVELWVNQQPLRILPVVGVIALWWLARQLFRSCMRVNAIALRKIVVAAIVPDEDDSAVPASAARTKYVVALAAELVFIGAAIFVLWGYFSGVL